MNREQLKWLADAIDQWLEMAFVTDDPTNQIVGEINLSLEGRLFTIELRRRQGGEGGEDWTKTAYLKVERRQSQGPAPIFIEHDRGEVS